MELHTIEETKMLQVAIYAINTYGITDGVVKYNNAISCLTTCKKKTCDQLQIDVDNASA